VADDAPEESSTPVLRYRVRNLEKGRTAMDVRLDNQDTKIAAQIESIRTELRFWAGSLAILVVGAAIAHR